MCWQADVLRSSSTRSIKTEMQDFQTPFNPHATEPQRVQTTSGEVLVRPECCGSVCSPDCVVTPEAKDTDIVNLKIPVGHQCPDPADEANWEPVIENGVQIGQTLKSGEIYDTLTLTVGQLKDLALGRIFVAAGNYGDTQAVISQVRQALKS
jgi:hypothetical protein